MTTVFDEVSKMELAHTVLLELMSRTFVMCSAAVAFQNGFGITGRAIKKIAAVGAEHKRSDRRHFEALFNSLSDGLGACCA